MTKGDLLIGKKTYYKSIEFKSRWETEIALFLDKLNIKWEYEPKRFMLSNGILYIPDFYLPELKTWIEAKGVIEEHNRKISLIFVNDNKEALILISPELSYYYGVEWIDIGDKTGYEDEEVQVGKCSKCNSHYFCSGVGDWRCNKCWGGEGKMDLISRFDGFQNFLNKQIRGENGGNK